MKNSEPLPSSATRSGAKFSAFATPPKSDLTITPVCQIKIPPDPDLQQTLSLDATPKTHHTSSKIHLDTPYHQTTSNASTPVTELRRNVVQTPHHQTSAGIECVCGNAPGTLGGLLQCAKCKFHFHAECVGMNFLTTTEHPFSVNGVFYVPEWVCPECILVTRLLKPGGPLFDHITQTFMQLLKPGYPLFEALADKAASKSVSQNVSELDQIFYQPENRTPQPPTPTLVEDPAPEPRPTIAEDSSELQDTPSYADSLSQETPSADSPTIEETTADQTHHKPDPAVQRKTRISQPRMVIYSNDTASTKTAIETALSDIPVSFMRKNSKSIVIGFPNKLCHQKAVKALAPIQDSFNRVSNEALGKITLREVPIDFISEDTPHSGLFHGSRWS